jgi:hypothetical protein
MERMKLMAMMVDAAKGAPRARHVRRKAAQLSPSAACGLGMKGGALVSALGAYLQHGDALVAAFVTRVMEQVGVDARLARRREPAFNAAARRRFASLCTR